MTSGAINPLGTISSQNSSLGSGCAQPEPKELFWEDMVPKGFIAPEVTVDHLNNMSQACDMLFR